MAILFSNQSGNFTDSSTWSVVNAASYLDSRINLQALTSSENQSAAFTPGAITTSGIILQVGGRVTAPTGTMTVRLFNNTASAIVKDVTVNVSDLPNTNSTSTGYIGWTYFKFDADVLLIAGNSYSIRAFSSVNSVISVYRDGTTNNWSRGLVTTTSQAPAATDILITGGVFQTPGVNSINTVTMNSTSLATTYGNIYVGSNGTFNYGTNAATNYGLKFAGNLLVGMSGVFTIGTQAIPIPANSTAKLEMTCTSAGQFLIDSYGTFITNGATRTLRSKLNADVAVGNTTSTITDTSDWVTGDVIAIPGTRRLSTESETITLTSNASGTSLVHTPYAFEHGGNSVTLVQADLALLTRNVEIYNTNTATRGYIQFNNNSTAIIRYTEFFNWGFSTTVYGISFSHTTLGTAIFDFNSYYATSRQNYLGFNLSTGSVTTSGRIPGDINGNVFYNLSLTQGPTSINGVFKDDNLSIANGGFQAFFGIIIGNRNVIASSQNHGASGTVFAGDVYDTNVYSSGSLALYFQGTNNTLSFNCYNLKIWRNNVAFAFQGTSGNTGPRSTFYRFINTQAFGNNNTTFSFSVTFYKIIFENSYFWGGDAIYRTPICVAPTGVNSNVINTVDSIYFNSCKFGIDYLDVENLFATACLQATFGSSVVFNNCKFAGVENQIFGTPPTPTYSNVGYVSLNHNEVEDSYRLFGRTFNALGDTTYKLTEQQSIRIIPASATQKAFTQNVRIPVKKNTSATISVSVRKSANIVDTQYNGADPRLMWVYNPMAGNLSETVCATYPNYGNLIAQPENLSIEWLLGRTTLGSLGSSPIGYVNAYSVIVNNATPFVLSGAGSTSIYGTSFNTFVGVRNVSVYVKKSGLNLVRLMIGASSALTGPQLMDVNLDTGAIISTNGTNAVVEVLEDGWYRLSVDLLSVSATNNRVAVGLSDTVKTEGNGVDGVFIWGFQMTEGSGVKPYIPFGSWQELTYTTPVVPMDSVLDFYVDCSGTAGFINVDDWSSTGADTKTNTYWMSNGPFIEADWTQPSSFASAYID
jgi:hypothetical protein